MTHVTGRDLMELLAQSLGVGAMLGFVAFCVTRF